MRRHLAFVLLALLLSAASCGGDDGGDATGSTGATGTDEIARFTAAVNDPDGGNTLSLSGVSCDGLNATYEVTIAVQGNLTGETVSPLDLVDGSGTLEWSMDVTGAEEGTLSGEYVAELSEEASVLLFTGTTSARTASGDRSFQVRAGDIPITLAVGACPN